jgi:predicted N-acyltransferase
VVQNPDEQTINEIFSLFWQTYEHGKTKFERLNKLFFANIAKEKVSWWVLLRNPADGKLVAFMLCFLLGDRVINKFIGLDYTIAKDNYLYFRLWNAAMEWMTSIGIKEMQSGQTGYRFKLDVGNSLVPMYNYFWHKSPIIHWVYSQFTKNTPWSELDEELKLYLKAHPDHDHPNK